jgi:hypothetical protein
MSQYDADHPECPTRFDRPYASTLPAAQQQWLFDNAMDVWYDGLPAFAQEFLKREFARSREADAVLHETSFREWVAEFVGPRRAGPTPERAGPTR